MISLLHAKFFLSFKTFSMLTYNFPLCVVLVFFPPFWTDAVGNVAIVVSFQKRSKRFVVSRAAAQTKEYIEIGLVTVGS